MDAMIARVLKSLLIAGAVLVAGCGCGFAVDDILPVEFRCFSKSAQLYSMSQLLTDLTALLSRCKRLWQCQFLSSYCFKSFCAFPRAIIAAENPGSILIARS